jgi:hypothetical protein
VAKQSETLVGCNSLVTVAAQFASNRCQEPDESVLCASDADSREDFRGRFQEPGRKRFRWYVLPNPKGLARVAIVSEKLKFLTNDCR